MATSTNEVKIERNMRHGINDANLKVKQQYRGCSFVIEAWLRENLLKAGAGSRVAETTVISFFKERYPKQTVLNSLWYLCREKGRFEWIRTKDGYAAYSMPTPQGGNNADSLQQESPPTLEPKPEVKVTHEVNLMNLPVGEVKKEAHLLISNGEVYLQASGEITVLGGNTIKMSKEVFNEIKRAIMDLSGL